jgi:hypothetical protein
MNRISKRLRRKEERDINCLPYFLQRWRIELSWKRRLRGVKLPGNRLEVNMASLDLVLLFAFIRELTTSSEFNRFLVFLSNSSRACTTLHL